MDVEKVEWLNRRSYSVIGLSLGREGRILFRTENDLEDWFELLDVRPNNIFFKASPFNCFDIFFLGMYALQQRTSTSTA